MDYVTDFNYCFLDLVPGNGAYVVKSMDSWADSDKRYTSSGALPYDSDSNLAGQVYGNYGQFIKLRKAGHKFNFGIALL